MAGQGDRGRTFMIPQQEMKEREEKGVHHEMGNRMDHAVKEQEGETAEMWVQREKWPHGRAARQETCQQRSDIDLGSVNSGIREGVCASQERFGRAQPLS